MNLCQDHWDKLKKALDDRGLTPYIKSAQANFEQIASQLKGTNEHNDPGDPLMNASFAIMNNALRLAGLQVMEPNEDGSMKCPICFLKTCPCGRPECPDGFEDWINKAADGQREHFADVKPQA